MKTPAHTRKEFHSSSTLHDNGMVVYTLNDSSKSTLHRCLKGVKSGTNIVIRYGGNNCNFDWKAVASSPEADHLPKVNIEQLCSKYNDTITQILAADCNPIITTLPTLLPQRYFDHISRGLDKTKIMEWLHNDVNTMSSYHEQFNHALKQLAQDRQIRLVDITNLLIDHRSLGDGYCRDGMHPNKTGNAIINEALRETFFAEK